MKAVVITFFMLWLLCLQASAQTPSWLWGRGNTGAGVDAYAIATDAVGNVYAGGYNYGYHPATFGTIVLPNTCYPTGQQALWVKYSSNGTPLWADAAQDGNSWLYNLTTDHDGNLIVFGSFSTPTIKIHGTTLVNALGASGESQFFIAKYTPSGSLLWAKSDGCAPETDNFFLGIWILSTGGVATDASGNIYITSSFKQPHITIGATTLDNADATGASRDVFVAKYDPSGTLVWAKRAGGVSDEFAYGIAASPSGKVYVTGPIWSPSFTFGSSVVGNPYASSGYGTGSKPMAYIAEFSAISGDALWAQAPGGNLGAYGIGVACDNAGNIYMAGGFCNPAITFGSVAATRAFPSGAPNLALYLVRYSPSHAVTWSKTISSPSQAVWGFSIGLACGEVWVSGNYKQDADVDGNVLHVVPGPDPVFIAGYNFAGGVVGYSGLGSGGDDQNGIAVDPTGNVFICSDYEDAGTFAIGPDTLLTSPTALPTIEYLYVGKYFNVGSSSDTTFTHQDTSVCQMANMVLHAPAAYGHYYWDNDTAGVERPVSVSGAYWVTCVKACTPVLVDTFRVTMLEADTVHSTTNISVCDDGSVFTMQGDAGYLSYIWNTGNTETSLTTATVGVYWVDEVNGCNMGRDTFNVSLLPLPDANLGNDTFFCFGKNMLLHPPPQAGMAYTWNTGSTDNAINITDSGAYYVTVSKDGCQAADTINIRMVLPPRPIYIGPDTTACSDDPYILMSGSSLATWNTGDVGAAIAVEKAGTYFATVTNSCGSFTDSATISFVDCNIWLPTAFTPNGGTNDIFRVRGVVNYFSTFSLSVYNRFGQCVFYTEDRYAGWNGKFNNIPQEIGTYFYMVKYELNGKHHLVKGDVELVR